MTTADMIKEFNILKDLYQAPYYDIDDILLFLNDGASAFVDGFYPLQVGTAAKFQKNQRSTDSIYTLIKTQSLTVATASVSDLHTRAIAYIELPSDYRHFETCEIKFGTDYPNKITVENYDTINQLFSDPFSVPNNTDNVYLCWHSNKILIFAASVPTTFKLIYCKNPATITTLVNCDLPILAHKAIVKMAVAESIAVSEEETRAKLLQLMPR